MVSRSAIVLCVSIAVVALLFGGSLTWADEIVLKSVKRGESTGLVQAYGLTRADLDRLSDSIPGLQTVAPSRSMLQVARRREAVANVQLIGAIPELAKLNQIQVKQGRFLTEDDCLRRNNLAVIDVAAANRLFASENPIGKNIRMGKNYFLVVGVIAEPKSRRSQAGARGRPAARVYIPLTAMRVRFGDTVVRQEAGAFVAERYELSEIRLVLSSGTATAARETVKSLLRRTHDAQDYSIDLLPSKPNR